MVARFERFVRLGRVWIFAKNPPIASESLPLERVLAKEHQYLSDSEAVIIGRLGNRNRFDVGVILGARLNETDFSPSMRLQSRVRHAIEGFCYGEIEHLIFSGAAGRKNTDGRKRPSEARAMFEYAKETVEKAPKMRGKRAQEYRCPFELERFSKAKEMKEGIHTILEKTRMGISSRGYWKSSRIQRRRTRS